MKRLQCMILTAALTVSVLAGCGAEQGGETTTEEPAVTETEAAEETAATEGTKIGTGKTVGIVMVTSQSQWCNDMVAAVSEVVKEEGFEVNVSDSQVSVDNEVSGMENLINAGCSAIVINAMNPAGLADLCKTAQEKGIFIIGWSDELVNYDALVIEDTDAEANMIAEAIRENNEEGSEMATIWLSDAANPDTTTGVFKASLEKAFDEVLVKGHNVNIVNEQYAADTNAAMQQTEAILAANPDVKIIFTQSDEMGVAVSQTLQSLGKTDIYVCGLDGCEEAVNVISAGNAPLQATVFSDIHAVGNGVGEVICSFVKDGTKRDVTAEYTLLTTENAVDFK